MRKNCVFLICLLSFCGINLKAQTLIGYVYDEKLGEPVYNATVYLDGTSFNTITDANGRFELNVGRQINTSLVISYLIYERMVIDSPFHQMPDMIYLRESIEQIEEVVVKGGTEKYDREKKLKAFRDQFLGTNTGGKRSRILNEEDIRLIYDSERRQLTATANVPILIENNYLGYELSYDLKEFTVWYSDNSLSNSKMMRSYYLGTSFFKDTGNNNSKLINNRTKVYRSSINNFIRNLYNGTLDESGFTIWKNDRILRMDDCFKIEHRLEGALVVLNDKTFPDIQKDKPERISSDNNQNNDDLAAPHLEIIYRNTRSQIFFYTDTFLIDDYHIISPHNKISFAGNLGGQRVGNLLPSDYIPTDVVSHKQLSMQQDNKISDHFREQLQTYPQEKIHLHTDRDYFVPGERIWFKAYLTDATTHQASSLSRYIYVELINPSGELVDRKLIRPENGMYYGHLFLAEMIDEGSYTLRAYTRYMDRLDTGYYFTKPIRIGAIITDRELSSENKKRKQKIDFEVSFFPEGGQLLEGTICNVAFKALDKNGISIPISGVVVDDEENIKTNFNTIHAGMGLFGFMPESDKKYYAECTDDNGHKKRFDLPIAVNNTYSIMVAYDRNDRVVVKRLKPHKTDLSSPVYLLLHCRGQLLYFDQWNESKDVITFTKDEFPTGILHILLLDEQMNPLSERLVFNRYDEDIQLEFATDKENYEQRDLVTTEMVVTDWDGMPLAGDFSVSVTDDKDQVIDHNISILSTLLLTSELKGFIESPAYYLTENSHKSRVALDCLMLTHGWRRYNIPEVIKGIIEKPEVQPETSLAISGKVTNRLTGRSQKNRPVDLMVLSSGESFSTLTDDDGYYQFSDFEFPDSTKFFLQSKKDKGNPMVELHIDQDRFPALRALPEYLETIITRQDTTIPEMPKGTFIQKAGERFKYDDEMRIMHLEDVKIVAQKQKKDPPPFSVYSKFAEISIGLSELEERKPITLVDLFSGISGLQVIPGADPNEVSLFFSGGFEPAIFIDDMYMAPEMGSPLSMINATNVERIDVFKPGASSGIYGLLGANGVISISTKKGASLPENSQTSYNQKTITPLGYQRPVEFYSPRYDTQERKFDIMPDLRTTIFWKPDIVTGSDGKAAFDFYTSDFSTTYSVVIEGVSHDGRIVREVKKIRVK